MVKFKDIITRLSIDEKAKLIAGLEANDNSLLERIQRKIDYCFSDEQLNRTCNSELKERVTIFFTRIIDILTNNALENKISSALKIDLTDVPSDTDESLLQNLYLNPIKNLIEKNYKLKRVYLKFDNHSYEFYEKVRKILYNDFKFKGIIFADVCSEKDYAINMSIGNGFIILRNANKEQIINIIIEKINGYRRFHQNLIEGFITDKELQNEIISGNIIDENALELGIYKFLSYLAMINGYSLECIEKELNNLKYDILIQSTVIIKNKDELLHNTLPILNISNVMIIGKENKEVINNDEYFVFDDEDTIDKKCTNKVQIKKKIDKIDKIKKIYYHGYSDDEALNKEYYNDVISNCQKDSIILLFLKVDDGKISGNQIDLLDELKNNQTNTICILPNENINTLSIYNKCNAILISNAEEELILKIILGQICPSGKLTKEINILNSNGEIEKSLCNGYGLSFVTLELDYVIFNEKGINIAITNTSSFNCNELLDIYQVENDSENNYLLSSTKYSFDGLKRKIIYIPFTDKIFDKWIVNREKREFSRNDFLVSIKIQDEEKGLEMDKSKAEMYLKCNDEMKIIDLKDCSYNSFNDNTSNIEKIVLPKKARDLFSILLFIYIDIIFIVTFIALLDDSKDDGPNLLVALIIFVLFNIIYICFFVKNSIKIKKKYRVKAGSKKQIVEKVFLLDDVQKIDEAKEDEEDYYELFSEKKKVHLIAEYVKMKEVCDKFILFAKNRGLVVSQETIRSIFAAFSSSKIVFVKNENHDLTVKFIKILNEYLGNRYYCEEAKKSWHTPNDLLWKSNGDKRVPTNFLKGFITSFQTDNNINIVSLDNINYDNFLNYFKEFLVYLQGNAGRRNIFIGDRINKNLDKTADDYMDIPNNLWYMFIVSEHIATQIPYEIAALSTTIELQISLSDTKEKIDLEYKILAYTQFNESLKEYRSNKYIDEETWKKIDKIVEFIDSITPFELSNRVFCRLEDYADAYLSCEVEEHIAMDSMLSNKLLPLLLTYDNIPIDGETGLSMLIDKVFGVDNTALSQNTLVNFNKNK